jgi:hypothetical protein
VSLLLPISSIVAEEDAGNAVTPTGKKESAGCFHIGNKAEAIVQETLAKGQSSCNYLLLPLQRAKEELSVTPKRGFGLMFLSAVRFHALHGLLDLPVRTIVVCHRGYPEPFFIAGKAAN